MRLSLGQLRQHAVSQPPLNRSLRLLSRSTALPLAFISSLLAPALTVDAAVIFSNFGSGDTYDANASLSACAGAGCQGAGGRTDLAAGFTPSSSFSLDSIQLALSQSPFGFPGPNSVQISLRTDAGGQPSQSLETFTLNGVLGPFGQVNPLVTAESTLHPSLFANTPYWIVVSEPSSAGRVEWNRNSIGDLSLSGVFNPGWSSSSGVVDRGAFRLTGTPISPVLPPDPYTLAKLSNDVFQSTGDTNGYALTSSLTGSNGFKANVYTKGGQVVIAVRGTDPSQANTLTYNALADGSFFTGLADQNLRANVSDLAGLLVSVARNASPGAQITLTGYSLGGAIAQIVGYAANVSVTSFDAPGAGTVYATSFSGLANTLGPLHIPTRSNLITNYRLYGDQISFVGVDNELGSVITIDQPSRSRAQIDTPVALVSNFFSNHDLQPLLNQLSNPNQPKIFGAIGTDIVPQIVFGVTLVQGLPVETITLTIADAAANFFFDPGPGAGYEVDAAAGSPFFQSLQLPIFEGIAGWDLEFHNVFGWSPDEWIVGPTDVALDPGVDGLRFAPLDGQGNPILNVDPFIFGVTFDRPGFFQGTVTTFAVPGPPTLSVLLVGVLGLTLFRRSLWGRGIRNQSPSARASAHD